MLDFPQVNRGMFIEKFQLVCKIREPSLCSLMPKERFDDKVH